MTFSCDVVAPLPQNTLLRALPAQSLALLLPRLSLVALELGQVLHPVHLPVTTIYFPETGLVSMVGVLADGGMVEVGLIGYEAMVGLPVLLGAEFDDQEAMVQAAGTALCLSAASFRKALAADPILKAVLMRFVLGFLGQVARTAVCNGRHQVPQRLARWLLMAQDRLGSPCFRMTHELLAMMLGVRRAGVSVAAAALQAAGIVRYERGTMTVLDRPRLEQASCECYRVVRDAYDRMHDEHLPDAAD